MSRKNFSEKKIKNFLERQYEHFHKRAYLKTDPLDIVYGFPEKERALVALITAVFSYGRVSSINSFVKSLLLRLENEPTQFLKQHHTKSELQKKCSGLVYRFYSNDDIVNFLHSIQLNLRQWKDLNELAHYCWKVDHLLGLKNFQNSFLEKVPNSSRGLRFMFSDPSKSSAKRWHMFLRWMVRSDEIDLGLWDFIPTKNLLIPLDVHLFRISRNLNLTQRKTTQLATTLEVSEALRKFDPHDPIRFDFSLCRWGMFESKTLSLN
ncbi:MAG: TIGR02757 family protein [Bdellovibrionota bacterium]